MDLLQLKKSALLYAGAASLIIVLSSFEVRGMWMLEDFGNSLWLFYFGFMVSWLCKLPRWLRIVLLICGLGLVFSTPQQHITYMFSCQLTWHLFGYILLGAAVPSRIDNKRHTLSETMVLSLLFLFIYITCVYLSQRAHTAVYECPGDLVNNLNFRLYCLSFFPLLGFLYCFIHFALQDKVQSLLNNKVIRWCVFFICIVAFVIRTCTLTISFEIYGWIKLLLCPAIGGLALMGVMKLLEKRGKDN